MVDFKNIGQGEALPKPDAKPVTQTKSPLEIPKPALDRFNPTRDENPGLIPRHLGKKLLQDRHLSPERPSIPLLSPKVYQRILAQFGALRGSELHQILERRFAESQNGGKSATRPVPRDVLARLIRMRHQGQDKGAVFQFVRNEIRQAKQAREQAAAKQEGAGESAKSESKKDAENFLKSSSRVFSNIQDAAESPFESLLKKAFAGKWNAEPLPEGNKGNYASKSQAGWKSFFANIMLRGSVEKMVQQQVSDVMEAFFRGMYEGASGTSLVTDLRVAQGESQMMEKFVRILIDNPSLLKAFQALKPGDPVPKELMKQLGESLQCTKLEHQPVVPRTETGESVLQQLRQMSSPTAQSRMEQSLIQERQKRREEAPGMPLPWQEGAADDPKNPLYYQGVYPRSEDGLHVGKSKLLVYMTYSLLVTVLGLVGFWISRLI